MIFASLLSVALAISVQQKQAHGEKRVFLDHAKPITQTYGWTPVSAPPAQEEIELLLALHVNDAAKLETKILQVSDPTSTSYAQYLSVDELTALVAPSDEALQRVKQWIESAGARVHNIVATRDWITVKATPAAASALLATEFHVFAHPNAPAGTTIVRAVQPLSVPLSVAQHVAFVANVHSFPSSFRSRDGLKVTTDEVVKSTKKRQGTDPSIGPMDLRRRYNVTGYNNVAASTAAVAEFQAQYYTPSDLTAFMQQFQPAWLNTVDVEVVPQGSNDPSAPGVEASLDIQYVIGVSPNTTTTFYASATFDFWSGLSTWASLVASQSPVPLVISVSYGDQDPTSKPGTQYEQRLSQEFQKIGLRGVSLIFASGDSGSGCNLCIYDEPSFPATSPYVTAVGATRFIHGQLNGPEMAVNEFGSGGGFSWTFPQPSYQAAAVQAYLTKNKGDLPWWFEFNQQGRATPDVAALGIGFQVVNGGATISVGGTSASAPTFAAIVSLLNSQRLAAGKPPMGFLNPWIYQTWAADPTAFFDVTEGNSYASCCIGGFACAPGFDAVSGVGTANFRSLVKHI